MSALDQAIIKAYAKDRPAAATLPAARPAPAAVAPLRPARASAVEQLYQGGSLYRLESPGVAPRVLAPVVPMPHLPQLPPTSPRRNVRRSVLRLLAANQASVQVESPNEPPPRIARKVIIRHVSHGAAPPPLGILRPADEEFSALLKRKAHEVDLELPPEKLIEEQQDPPDAPPKPAAPLSSPLNVADAASSFEVTGEWLHESSLAPLVMLARHPADAQLMVQWDAVAAATLEVHAIQRILALDAEREAAAARFTTKSLDNVEERQTHVYFDAPHAHGRHRPHAPFPVTPADAESAEAPVEPLPTIDDVVIPAVEPETKEPTFEEAFEAALASDLIPHADADEPKQSGNALAAAATNAGKSALPVWEVDRFHWPRTCEKLLADEYGYLSTAGDKLLAAVQDGLRVLGITGSRRGEGRSTLALCLARAAAKAGVQVAVMDADFARPQLASKLGLETAFGWQDAALGKIPLSEAAIKSLAEDITVLPLELSAATRRLSLADPRVTATIRAAAATFELLILDMGPISDGEQLAFPPGEACPLDAAIVVRDVRFAIATQGETIGHMLQDLGVEAVGIAENFVIDEEIPATSV